MDNVQVVILSKSYKNGGRCIAGKVCEYVGENTVSLLEWTRPVLIDADGNAIGPITESEYQYTSGGYLQVLDIAHIPKLEDCTVSGQPDNFVVERRKKWAKHSHFRADCVFKIVEKPADIWLDAATQTNKVTRAYVKEGRVTQSLYLIRPESLRVTLSNKYNEWKKRYDKKALASFRYNNVLYEDISITCPAARKMLKERYPNDGGDDVTFSLLDGDRYALVLSLSPVLEATGMHYKFVATIFDSSGSLQKDFKA